MQFFAFREENGSVEVYDKLDKIVPSKIVKDMRPLTEDEFDAVYKKVLNTEGANRYVNLFIYYNNTTTQENFFSHGIVWCSTVQY